jgi:hypothetical protein
MNLSDGDFQKLDDFDFSEMSREEILLKLGEVVPYLPQEERERLADEFYSRYHDTEEG